MAEAHVDESGVVRALGKITASANLISSVNLLQECREVDLKYRAVDVKYMVKSVADEVEMRTHTRIRGALVTQGVLAELPGEGAVCEGKGACIAKIAPSLAKHSTVVRRFFNSVLKEEKVVNGDVVMVLGIEKHNLGIGEPPLV